jgi:hypothetical protein
MKRIVRPRKTNLKYASVSVDEEGNAFLSVAYLDKTGEILEYLGEEELQSMADWLNGRKGWEGENK